VLEGRLDLVADRRDKVAKAQLTRYGGAERKRIQDRRSTDIALRGNRAAHDDVFLAAIAI